ncbi:MAG: tRNA (adenosine(37)-N6)-threonylcarbamoyltransferase complex dimerization subunit type 1 TsaB [Gammaproteobacteria bacterium]
MKLLAIETATESCSAALLLNDEVFSLSEVAPRRHNEIILSMCEQVLAQGQTSLSQLEAVAFGRGPGAFTGLRLAASVTQGIALGQDLPVVQVSTLASLAQQAFEENEITQVLSCIDARMQEIYYGFYKVSDLQIMELVGEEKVVAPKNIEVKVSGDCYGVGSGWAPYAQLLQEKIGTTLSYDASLFPQAEYVAKLAKVYFEQGKSVTAVEALPIYLRDNVAEKSKKKMVF